MHSCLHEKKHKENYSVSIMPQPLEHVGQSIHHAPTFRTCGTGVVSEVEEGHKLQSGSRDTGL